MVMNVLTDIGEFTREHQKRLTLIALDKFIYQLNAEFSAVYKVK